MKRLILLMFMLTSATAFAGRVEALSDPTMQLSPGYTTDQVRKALAASFLRRGWELKSEEDGKLLFTIHVRVHVAETEVSYSARKIEFSLKSSSNLKYKARKSGQKRIHRSYNRWILNVIRDTRVALKLSQ